VDAYRLVKLLTIASSLDTLGDERDIDDFVGDTTREEAFRLDEVERHEWVQVAPSQKKRRGR
jgi:hypothetical protein